MTPVLLLQTLHFLDKEKVEEAVGLSIIYQYENQRDSGDDGGGERVVGGGRRLKF